jgi:nucleoside-diphosphate-sugar epimerase
MMSLVRSRRRHLNGGLEPDTRRAEEPGTGPDAEPDVWGAAASVREGDRTTHAHREGTAEVIVCGPAGSVIVEGVAAGLARHRDQAVGRSVRVVALDTATDNAALLEQLAGVRSAVLVARDPSEDLRAVRDREDGVTESAERLFAAIDATTVDRLVVVTSAVLFGLDPDNPVPLPEKHTSARPSSTGLLTALGGVEAAALELRRRRPDLRLALLRPAALVAPGIDGDVTRHFAAPRLLGLRDTPMAWQFCHVDDLASAVALVLETDLADDGAAMPTPIAVGAPGWLTDDDVAVASGKRRIDLPPSLVFATADRLQRLGATVSGSVQALVYPWVVEPTRLTAAGWRPTYDNPAALEAMLAEARSVRHEVARRRGREAAGAAGATVAALGTALVVRRARRRRQQG